MPSLADALRDPIPLAPNRPSRFYRGGRLLAAFRGDQSADDDRPEDWVGSATRAWQPPGAGPSDLGLSTVEVAGARLTLEEILRREPEALVGRPLVDRAGPTLGLLVKLLDAGERLPVHAHPTRGDAARHLGSAFGKTEAWIVLGVRDSAPGRVWVGFREPVEDGTLREWIDAQRTERMLEALDELEVSPGDVILVPGGTPHAIGAGVFLLELQEPTDFSIVAETRGFRIAADDASLGLGWDVAAGMLHTQPLANVRQRPERGADGLTRLFESAADAYFRAFRVTADRATAWPLAGSPAIGVVLDGAGEVRGPGSMVVLRRGTTFMLPAAGSHEARLDGSRLELVACLPPDPAKLDLPLPQPEGGSSSSAAGTT